jgi:hypothetical protein
VVDSLAAGCSTAGNLRVATWIDLRIGHINRLHKFATSSTEGQRPPPPES